LGFAEALRKRTDLDATQQRGVHQILFKCYIELGLKQKDLEKFKGLATKARAEAEWFAGQAEKATDPARKQKLKDRYDYMINKLASANADAMQIALKLGREAPKDKQGYFRKEYDEFKRRRGELIKKIVSQDKYKTIDGLGLLAKIFLELEDYEQAREAYDELLEKYDPEDDRMKKTDDRLVDFAVLMEAVTTSPGFDDLGAIRAGRRHLGTVKLFMFGQKGEKDKKDRWIKRPVDKDYDKAVRLIEAFLKEHPKYGYEKKEPGKARKGLEEITEELLFRLKLLRAANGRTNCYVARGEQLHDEEENEKAKKSFENGLKSAEDALKYWPKDADVRYNYAICLLFAGGKDRLERAQKEFDNLRRCSRYKGEIWWKATKGAVKARIELADYDGARMILAQLLLTDPEAVKEGWPNVATFVRRIAKEKNIPEEQFLGKKVDLGKFDYRPRSDLQKLVDRRKLHLQELQREGKLSKEELLLRAGPPGWKHDDANPGLLDELLILAEAGRLKGTDLNPEDLVYQFSRGMYTSLKNLGGVSRGPKYDKLQPELKGKGEKPEEKKKDEGKKGADAGAAEGAAGLLTAAGIQGGQR